MLAKTTKLQAINTMLSAIGEPPINTLSSQRADSNIAEQILDEVSREVQSYGWHFNTEINVTVSPDSNGNIIVSENVARVDTDPTRYTELDITLRGDKLFDRVTNSSLFASSLVVNRVVMLEFEEMPEQARRYVMIRAARIFGDRMVGSEKHHMFTGQDEMLALARMREYENDTADHSIFDDYSVASVINRNSSYRTI
jgi:hypothetical protein